MTYRFVWRQRTRFPALPRRDKLQGKFVDVFAGSVIGLDHGWSPKGGLINSTQATTITFSSGLGGGTGYDYYFDPIQVLKWGD